MSKYLKAIAPLFIGAVLIVRDALLTPHVNWRVVGAKALAAVITSAVVWATPNAKSPTNFFPSVWDITPPDPVPPDEAAPSLALVPNVAPQPVTTSLQA